MKKKSFVILLLGVIICIVACGKKKEDVSQADNVDNLNEKKYYALSLEASSYEDENAEETYEFTIGNMKYTGKYFTTNVNVNKYIMDIYLHTGDATPEEKGGTVVVTRGRVDDENVYEFVIHNPSYYGIEIESFSSDKEAAQAFESFASKYINTDEYTLNVSVKDDEYTYEYIRYIDGVKSEEIFSAYYTKDSDLIRFEGKYIKKYENKSLGDFDFEKAEEIAFNHAREIHGDDKEYYVQKKYVSTIDGKIGVVYLCCTEDYIGNEAVFVYME